MHRKPSRISSEALLARIQAGAPPAILDVRSRGEYAEGHVPGATHVPFWAVTRLFGVPFAKTEPLVVYCGHGPRAVLASAVLRAAGFHHIQLLTGHWSGWTRAGLPQAK